MLVDHTQSMESKEQLHIHASTMILYWHQFPQHSVVQLIPSFFDVCRYNVTLPVRSYFQDVTFTKIGLSEWLFQHNKFNDDQNQIDQSWRHTVDTAVC